MNKTKKVFGYVRCSSKNQDIENSFDYQINAIENYCKVNSYELVKIFSDAAKSGTSLKNRTGLSDMITTIKNQSEVKTVIFYKLERGFRNTKDGIQIIYNLKDNDIEVESCCESLRTDFDIELNLALASRYSENLSQYTSTSMINIAKKHARYLGGPVPTGFCIDAEGHYVADPEYAPAIKMIFDLYAKGYSYCEIAKALNNHHLYNRNGKPWTAKSDFHSILKNERYMGTYIYNRTERRKRYNHSKNHRKSKPADQIVKVENGCEQIVSEEVFNRCQEIMASRVKSKGTLKAKKPYKLSGIIYCGICGERFHGNSHGKLNWFTYRCSGHNKDLTKKCYCKEINRLYIERLAISIFTKTLKDKTLLKQICDGMNKEFATDKACINEDMERFKKKLVICQRNIDNLIKSIEQGILSEAINQRLQALEQEKVELEKSIDHLQKEAVNDNIKRFSVDDVKKLISNCQTVLIDSDDPELIMLLKKFYKKIVIDNDTITFHIDINGFFHCTEPIEDKILIYDRDYVIKYKGNLQKLNFRIAQSHKALAPC